MFELVNIDNSNLKELALADTDEVYALKKDSKILGYGIINETKPNKIELSILEEYRSNGYGEILFKLLIEKLKEKNYKDIILTISKENIPMKNIIEAQSGLLISNNKDNIKYIIKLKESE